MPATISINRAPVLTLWAAVVTQRIGFHWDESLSLGRALAGLNAESKGRRLGIFQPHEEKTKAARAAMTTLAHAYRPRELVAEALALYEAFRSAVPEGVKGFSQARLWNDQIASVGDHCSRSVTPGPRHQ